MSAYQNMDDVELASDARDSLATCMDALEELRSRGCSFTLVFQKSGDLAEGDDGLVMVTGPLSKPEIQIHQSREL